MKTISISNLTNLPTMPNDPPEATLWCLVRSVTLLLDHLLDELEKRFADDLDEDRPPFAERLKLHRREIVNEFVELWGQSLEIHDTEFDPVTANYDEKDMSLIEEDRLELIIAQNHVVHATNASVAHLVDALSDALSEAASSKGVMFSVRGLYPKAITRSFFKAFDSLELPNSRAIDTVSLYKTHIADHLVNVYQSALDSLQLAGIEVRARRGKRSLNRTPMPQHAKRKQNPKTVDGEIAQDVLDKLLSDPPTGETLTGILQGLDRLEPDFASATDPLASGQAMPNLAAFLMAIPTSQGGLADSGLTEQHTLHLVSALFEHVFAADDISVASVALLARLQIPVLKIAFKDPTLFTQQSHPVRVFISQLAADGVGWPVDPAQLDRHVLYQSAEQLVCKVRDAKDGTLAFKSALEEWGHLIARHDKIVERSDLRARERTSGEIKVQQAKQAVQRFFNQHAQGTRLPAPVLEFITETLGDVLSYVYLRHGPDNDEWDKSLDVTKKLIEVSQPSKDETELTRRKHLRVSIIGELIERITAAGRWNMKVSQQLDVVTGVIEAVTQADEDWYAGDGEYGIEFQEVEAIDLTEPACEDSVTDLFDHIIADIRPGRWVEHRDDRRRQRIVGYDLSGGLVTLTHDWGVGYHQVPARAFFEKIANRELRFVDASNVVAHSLQQISNDLLSPEASPCSSLEDQLDRPLNSATRSS